jgi:hypothetical protein
MKKNVLTFTIAIIMASAVILSACVQSQSKSVESVTYSSDFRIQSNKTYTIMFFEGDAVYQVNYSGGVFSSGDCNIAANKTPVGEITGSGKCGTTLMFTFHTETQGQWSIQMAQGVKAEVEEIK